MFKGPRELSQVDLTKFAGHKDEVRLYSNRLHYEEMYCTLVIPGESVVDCPSPIAQSVLEIVQGVLSFLRIKLFAVVIDKQINLYIYMYMYMYKYTFQVSMNQFLFYFVFFSLNGAQNELSHLDENVMNSFNLSDNIHVKFYRYCLAFCP